MMTKAEAETLSEWEPRFTTAINENWASCPPRSVLQMMEEILHREDRFAGKTNFNCQSCILSLLQKVGTMYFSAKAEYQKKGKSNGNNKNRNKANKA